MTRFQKTLMVASLVFNAAFLAGYLAPSIRAESDDPVEAAASLVSAELDLDTDQQRAFVELRKESEDRKRELTQAMALAHEKLVAELCKPKMDREAVQALKVDLAKLRDEHRELGFRQSDRFFDMLTPKQRENVGERFQRHGRRKRFDDDFVKEFDEDGDGRLSPRERGKAIHTIRERKGNGPKPRGPAERQGDADRRPPKGGRRGGQKGQKGDGNKKSKNHSQPHAPATGAGDTEHPRTKENEDG